MNVNHLPRKRFGQHFLNDRNIIEKIIEAIHPDQGQTILEIGPGQGALTMPLLQRVGELHAIEIDRDLAYFLTDHCKAAGKLFMHCADVLKFDLHTIANERIKVVGNLPYNISTPLIFHLLDQMECISKMIFMLQEEVVDRMVAIPGSKTYGRLSVMVQAQCRVHKLFRVPNTAFTPPPKVNSAIIKITPDNSSMKKINNFKNFSLIVRESFNQRRKTIRNALRKLLTSEQISSLAIDPGLRPEQLTINQFINLANFYDEHINQ